MQFPSHIQIGERRIGPGEPCYVIAEGGVSHFGQMDKARQLIDMAVAAGADVFKTQHYKTNLLIGPAAPEWRERLQSKEMPDAAIGAMQAYCSQRSIPFLCTPHDELALDFLDIKLKIPAFKVGSGELENWPFLANVGRRGKPVILSTGMHEIEQIKAAVKVLADSGCKQLAILHCVTSYPAPPYLINLQVMNQIREFFPGPVGYSDHTEGTAVCLAAAALGADIIEKHITIDKDVPNAQDWKVSCDPANFPGFVADIRTIEMARGGAPKKIGNEERLSIQWARKSLTAREAIPRGTLLTAEKVVNQRPGTGISPARLQDLLGRHALRDIAAGEMLSLEMFTHE